MLTIYFKSYRFLLVFIRRTTHTHKNGQKYHTYKLVESVRTQRGPRQNTLLNLGTDFSLPQEHWKELADRIEGVITGQSSLLPVSKEIETLAKRFARLVILKQSREVVQPKGNLEEAEYQTVDINSMDNEEVKSVGGESVVLETVKAIELDRKLEELGFKRVNIQAAIGVITARLLAISSEKATHQWLQSQTALDELMGTSFASLSQDRVYQVSDLLLRNKESIEAYLGNREKDLFNLEERIVLYDLTNTFFEGSGRYNAKAHFGVSKEKRTDCVLVTLGLVLDEEGFPKRSEVFEGNVSEAGTLEKMITGLRSKREVIVVVDGGIGTRKNIEWMRREGFGYIAVSRKRLREIPADLEMVKVRENQGRLIQASARKNSAGELEVYYHSSAKEIKETSITTQFEKRFEENLSEVQKGLSRKGGTKKYEKVLERIGRLKERYSRVTRRYEIRVVKDERSEKATQIRWWRKQNDDTSGYYVLRTNRTELTEKEVFDIFGLLLDVEDAFRSMKSELGLRPIHHQKESRCDGHLFITVLAYHILHAIQTKLKRNGITHRWSTIREMLSTHHRVTTSMRRSDGKMIYIRKTAKPLKGHTKIYNALGLPSRPGKTFKTIV